MSNELELHEVVLEPGNLRGDYLADLWQHRELFLLFARRDIVVRYRQAALGIAWALLRPVAMMVIFTTLFSRLAGLQSGGSPYALFVLAALVPWQLLAGSVSESSLSLVSYSSLITKVYFPRALLPFAAITVQLLDFAFSMAFFLIAMPFFGVWPKSTIFLLPLCLVPLLMLAGGVSLVLGALNVRFRDISLMIPFAVQFGLFVSPIGYGSLAVPAEWRMVFALNPVVGIVEGFRYALLGVVAPNLLYSATISCLISGIVFAWGVWWFRKAERTFADVI